MATPTTVRRIKKTIKHGDCLELLKSMDDNSIDSLVTDPPAGISFMGKAWDGDKGGRDQWIAWMSEVMQECLRVLKPGAHGLVWAIPRTSHWTATALEDAGFEIRDVVTHLFGSGFPKSLDISKAIDKAAGAEREVWQGWGTALKPASEHWILVRKPCSEKTVAANVLKHGCGGINIDASRIEGKPESPWGKQYCDPGNGNTHGKMKRIPYVPATGRFPANLVLSHNEDCQNECTPGCAVAELDGQSGTLVSKWGKQKTKHEGESSMFGLGVPEDVNKYSGDSGGASRFFYCAKASKSDKGKDNTHPTVKASKLMSYLIKMITPPEGVVLDPFMGSGSTGVAALKDGFRFVGIEKDSQYIEIAKARTLGISK